MSLSLDVEFEMTGIFLVMKCPSRRQTYSGRKSLSVISCRVSKNEIAGVLMGKLIDARIDKREHGLGGSGKPADRLMVFRALWERKARSEAEPNAHCAKDFI